MMLAALFVGLGTTKMIIKSYFAFNAQYLYTSNALDWKQSQKLIGFVIIV